MSSHVLFVGFEDMGGSTYKLAVSKFENGKDSCDKLNGTLKSEGEFQKADSHGHL